MKNFIAITFSVVFTFIILGISQEFWLTDSLLITKKIYNFLVICILSMYMSFFWISKINQTSKSVNIERHADFFNIEFLRIVFTLYIVLSHAFGLFKIKAAAGAGVEFFFILSGFLLAYKFTPKKGILQFIKSKLIRFVPLIFFWNVFNSVFEKNLRVTDMLSEIFLVLRTGIHSTHQGGYNPVCWYICVLFWVSILYFYLLKTQRKENVNIFLALITFFSYISCIQHNWDIWAFLDDDNRIFSIALMRGLGGVALGYFTHTLYQLCKNVQIVHKTIYNFLVLCVFSYSLLWPMVSYFTPTNKIFGVLSFSVLILLFSLNNSIISRFFNKAYYMNLSQYAFSIYLSHWFIVKYCYHSNFWPTIPVVENIVLILCCSIALGIIVYYSIEKPATKFFSSYHL